jgi:predicted  nucleic acid-binding Zn-ribbon protein
MCKKLAIAAVAVVVGLAFVLGGARTVGLLRVWKCKASTWAQNRVPPETEIERLKAEVARLKADDAHHYDKVARQQVEVKRRENEIARVKSNLEKLEANIRKMRDDVASGAEFVVYNGNKYSSTEVKEQLRIDFLTFQTAEENLKAREEQLKALKQTLTTNLKKVKALAQARQEMETELTRLQAALAKEREAQARSDSQLDDSNYAKVRADINAIRERIQVMQHVRELQGQSTRGPIRAVEEAREQDSKLDNALEARFGKVKNEVAVEK